LVLKNPTDVEGMPPSSLRLAASSYNAHKPKDAAEATPEAGPWRFSLDSPSYGPFMEHCRRRDLRETMYRAFVSRASQPPNDNSELIRRILSLRKEQAALLGFDNYAQMSLATKMAPGIDAVLSMLERLRTAAWPHGEHEMDELREIARREGQEEEVAHWDVAF